MLHMFSTVGHLKREQKKKKKPCIYLAHPAGTEKRDLPSKLPRVSGSLPTVNPAVPRLENTALRNVENGEEQGGK